jgi:hypothetical protein
MTTIHLTNSAVIFSEDTIVGQALRLPEWQPIRLRSATARQVWLPYRMRLKKC